MQDPLKQGLKLKHIPDIKSARPIRMQDPLKQGLKLFVEVSGDKDKTYSNARSTKTRIETEYVYDHCNLSPKFECKIH